MSCSSAGSKWSRRNINAQLCNSIWPKEEPANSREPLNLLYFSASCRCLSVGETVNRWVNHQDNRNSKSGLIFNKVGEYGSIKDFQERNLEREKSPSFQWLTECHILLVRVRFNVFLDLPLIDCPRRERIPISVALPLLERGWIGSPDREFYHSSNDSSRVRVGVTFSCVQLKIN